MEDVAVADLGFEALAAVVLVAVVVVVVFVATVGFTVGCFACSVAAPPIAGSTSAEGSPLGVSTSPTGTVALSGPIATCIAVGPRVNLAAVHRERPQRVDPALRARGRQRPGAAGRQVAPHLHAAPRDVYVGRARLDNSVLPGQRHHQVAVALGLHALHDALDGARAEVVGVGLHRQVVDGRDGLFLAVVYAAPQ